MVTVYQVNILSKFIKTEISSLELNKLNEELVRILSKHETSVQTSLKMESPGYAPSWEFRSHEYFKCTNVQPTNVCSCSRVTRRLQWYTASDHMQLLTNSYGFLDPSTYSLWPLHILIWKNQQSTSGKSVFTIWQI